jgi:hypothetical protein
VGKLGVGEVPFFAQFLTFAEKRAATDPLMIVHRLVCARHKRGGDCGQVFVAPPLTLRLRRKICTARIDDANCACFDPDR